MVSAEGKQRLEAQLATLRARDANMAPAELETHQRKKADLKFKLKNHIDPPPPPQPEQGGASAFLRNVADTLPSSSGASDVLSNFPNFTSPTLDDLGDFVGTVSFGSTMGFCSGYALKKIGRAGATTVGIIFMSLTAAERSGYIDVRWDNIERDVMGKVGPRAALCPPRRHRRRRRPSSACPRVCIPVLGEPTPHVCSFSRPRASARPRRRWQGRFVRRADCAQEVHVVHDGQKLSGHWRHVHRRPAAWPEEGVSGGPRPLLSSAVGVAATTVFLLSVDENCVRRAQGSQQDSIRRVSPKLCAIHKTRNPKASSRPAALADLQLIAFLYRLSFESYRLYPCISGQPPRDTRCHTHIIYLSCSLGRETWTI